MSLYASRPQVFSKKNAKPRAENSLLYCVYSFVLTMDQQICVETDESCVFSHMIMGIMGREVHFSSNEPKRTPLFSVRAGPFFKWSIPDGRSTLRVKAVFAVRDSTNENNNYGLFHKSANLRNRLPLFRDWIFHKVNATRKLHSKLLKIISQNVTDLFFKIFFT